MKAATHLLATFSLLSLGTNTAAQSIFDAPVNFSISRSCDATDSIRHPGNIKKVKPGEVYKAIGQNRAIDPTHALLSVNNKHRWVALE